MNERAPQQLDQDEPLDPAVEKVRAKLMRFVVINLGILFLALMAVVGALVYRSVSTGSSPEEAASSALPLPPEGSTITGEIALPAGANVVSSSLADGRLTLLVEAGGAREIVVYDIASARIIARFALVTE
ncbi:MAG: fimbrial protein [Rhizobiaceae bacterium]|nr:fimbrial protein [Rhizobiaceae bacterium]